VYRIKQDGARYAYPTMLAADAEGVAEAVKSLENLNPGTRYTSERLYNAPKVDVHPMAGVRSGVLTCDEKGIWRKS